MIAAQQAQTAIADRRARELDRAVAVQTEIATSRFDLDAVMNTVVQEALALTDAGSAVVEILDGRRAWSHRTAAGGAAEHLGMRHPRRTALSGAALRSAPGARLRRQRDGLRVERRRGEPAPVRPLDGRRAAVPATASAAVGVRWPSTAPSPARSALTTSALLEVLADVLGSAISRAELLVALRAADMDMDALTWPRQPAVLVSAVRSGHHGASAPPWPSGERPAARPRRASATSTTVSATRPAI